MGLCKCPKRKVTNQFCFEHSVNVCEFCMVANHPRCIVQSYLQWLDDSDYNPICELCSKELGNEDCVRLVCYHVFHWACIDKYGHKFPITTAAAGFTCPSCKVCLIPESNLVSPVADILRQRLASVNWARRGLGLPLLIEEHQRTPDTQKVMINDQLSNQNHVRDMNQVQQNCIGSESPHSVVHFEDSSAFSRNENQLPKRVFEDLDDPRSISFDHDEKKYKRKTLLDWFLRWWKSFWRPIPRGRLYYHRYCIRILLLAMVITIVLILFSWLGQIVTRNDPSLDFSGNPHIRVANVKET
ncbi:UNVERIFIED_CONTAM: hypothetical protein PYX00_007605 [Menopon gallinae]|uniref:Zinc finger protein-like 1 homolog n=1 Tax=Menopon gallinae TaxID=328185 RepID=A0AAW2HJL7_9NEOP